ncbi:MAG: AMP-binding protein [Cyanobacteriota bacterium]|nr:AMP-binding protein [Cyanobacteriota bacterium]
MSAASTAEIHWRAGARERRALAGQTDWSQLRGLEQLWERLSELHGDRVALEAPHVHPPVSLSYRQLHQRIEQAAAGFAALGVRAGDVVALFAENGPRWLQADQGLMRCGAIDAVRGSSAPVEELRYILGDCGAIGLVVESAALLSKLNLTTTPRAPLRFVVLLEGEPDPEVPGVSTLRWSDLMERGQAALKATAAQPPAPGDPARTATILYTSGTTGAPKGVPLSHANLLHQLQTLGVAVQPTPGDRVLSVLPIWHAYERAAEYFLFSCGCRQTYTTLKQLRSDLQTVRPHYLISVPRLWEALLSGFDDALAAMSAPRRRLLRAALAHSRRYGSCRRQALDLTLTAEPWASRLIAVLKTAISWPLHGLAAALLWPKVRQQLVGGALRTAISGGGALALHVDSFFEAIGIELLVGYGLTETSPVLTCRRRWVNRRGSAGQPLPETAIRIVDPTSRTPLAIGQQGLVLARGPQVMTGYLNKPEASARVFDADGWFDTGDLGALLADGSLVLTGRVKDTLVLSSGENIEPGPLEDCLVACDLVEQVMLVGQDRKSLGALVVPRLDALQELARQLNLTMPSSLPDGGKPGGAELPLLKAVVSQLNRRLAARAGARGEERLAGVALVEPFTIDNGLLTQTLKQRRDRIADRDAARIEAIYRGR